jgi:non-specific serine/threonine protein kinase
MPGGSSPGIPEALATALSERYRFTRVLGRGGMATVFLAEDLKHGRPVAIKVLDHEIASAVGPDRFLREIEIAARLTHPHILPLHDSGIAGDRFYYVTPYIAGESLRERIARERQLPLEDAVRLTREIASALGHAHHQGFVHRDIKPENVLLSDGIALVADFGIARATSGDGTSGRTSAGTAIGTPAYMAPEQLAGSPDIDGRADLYSLGCVLFEMLAGAPPFSGPVESLAYQHLSVTPRSVSELRPGLPFGVSATILKVLAKTPADRHATAERFVESLAAALVDSSSHADLAGTRRPPNNLPAERTSFVGRDQELAECRRVFEETRLLTLTGIGGSGKTRLALKLAEGWLETYPDGVWFVDLAPLTDESRVAETVATALGVRDYAGDPVESLRHHVRGKRLVLVLDNCEHLLSACATLVDALLDADAGFRVLATSREGLGVAGERLLAVRSLGVPPANAAHDVRRVEASEAVLLFVERARLAQPGFGVTEQNAAAVAEVCRRLDGIPLAIELAASRVRILSIDQIRARLDDRFRLLTGSSRTAMPRQQTLHAMIQWSYDQLAADEQRLFRCLAVFAGGWTLDAAVHVAGEGWDEFQVMDVLARLVDKSLVVVERERESEPRYTMLETVRQFGQERLIESGEGEAARLRHLDEFRSLAERAHAERFVRDAPWTAVLEAERGNLRAALANARASDTERYLALAGALAWYWLGLSLLQEGREHLTTALATAAVDPPRAARARALTGAGNILAWQGEGRTGLPWMQEAVRIRRTLGDSREIGLAIEAVGWAQFTDGDDVSARATFEECLSIQRDGGDPILVNRARVGLGQVLSALREIELVRPMAREIIAFSASIQDARSEHLGWHYLADAALIEGKCNESLGLYQKSLVLARQTGDRVETSFEVQGVAMSLAGLGQPAESLRLAGAARAEWGRVGAEPHVRFWDELMDQYFGRARRALGPAADAEWERGSRISFDEAVEIALRSG